MLLFTSVLLLLVRVLLFFVRVRLLLMLLVLFLMRMGLLLMTMRLLFALGMPSLVRVGFLLLIRGNCLCTLLYLLLLLLHSLGIPECLNSIGWTG